jgi:hypothetical protein
LRLSEQVSSIIQRDGGFCDPVATPSEIEIIKHELAHFERALQPIAENDLLHQLSILKNALPMRRSADVEVARLIDTYVEQLKKYPKDILVKAFGALIGTEQWFPAISKIHEACAKDFGKRHSAAMKMRQVIRNGPIHCDGPFVTPEQAADILKEFGLKKSTFGHLVK